MTWAEFLIRLHSYKRIEKKEWYKVREIAWNALIGSHYNPKKLPKSKEAFLQLEPNKVSSNNPMFERLRQEQEKYKQLRDGGQ